MRKFALGIISIVMAIFLFQMDLPSIFETDSKSTVKTTSVPKDKTKTTSGAKDKSNIEIPYDFSGELTYMHYRNLKKRILQFDNVTNIGKDQSKKYNMFSVELGNPNKPTILVIASMHGSEWQSAMYSMRFMEELRDGTFPDEKLRKKLITEFHIVYIPVVNPWGYDRATPLKLVKGRYNSTGTDLNRDFYKFTQAESKNVKKVMDKYRPFAFLDLHLMGSGMYGNEGNSIIIGNGQEETNEIRNSISDSLSSFTGEPVTKWEGWENLKLGLARTYMRNLENPETPYTLSYIFELAKPVERETGVDAPLANSQIMNYGMAGIYLFFRTSTMYYEEQHN